MKTILLAALAAFAFSHNVMADDTTTTGDAAVTKESTKTTDNGDGTQTTTHKHMKRGHGKMKMKKTEKTEAAPDATASPSTDDTTK